jgi:hypothetical protein
MTQPCIYVIGSLRNPQIPQVGNRLRAEGFEAFDEWFAGGPDADDAWQRYAITRGQTYGEALDSYVARNTFELDYRHLQRCDAAVLIAPAGKSAHLELGWVIGQGKPGFVLLDAEPERYDVMYQFTRTTGGAVCYSIDELVSRLALTFLPDAMGEVPF